MNTTAAKIPPITMSKLYIGNLPSESNENSLRQLFLEQNLSCTNILVKRGGYAFVDCPDQSSADKAIDKLNGFNYNGSVLVVEPSVASGKKRTQKMAPLRHFEGKKEPSTDSIISVTHHVVKKRSLGSMAKFRQEIMTDDHQIPLQTIASRYNTDLTNGLDSAKANALLLMHGPNCLVPPPATPMWAILLKSIFGGFNMLLWAGAVLSLIGYFVSYYSDGITDVDQIYLSAVLALVSIISGTFGFMQEHASTTIMESFKNMVPKQALVVRGGTVITIPCEEIVVGDIVQVKVGDCVPADMRVISCNQLKVDNSSITGESEPQSRSTECTDSNPIESKNMLFFGTNVIEGEGVGIVVACGDNTLMGHIAGLTSNLEEGETPLKKEMRHFIKMITILAFVVGISFFLVAICTLYSFFAAFAFFIALVVANVPEGLIVTLTACLTLTAKRMKHKHCMIKDLQAVETLGSTNVICSDKTGTLTQNRMTVSHVYYNSCIVDVLLPAKGELTSRKEHTFRSLCLIGIICNSAKFNTDQEHIPIDRRNCTGNASEIGILRLMEKIVGHVMRVRKEHDIVCKIPFNSTNKYEVSIHVYKTKQSHYYLAMKGAPETVLERCSTIAFEDGDEPLDVDKRHQVNRTVLELGYLGERVLGFADMWLPSETYAPGYQFDADSQNFPLINLRFVGLMSLIDPPRNSVPDAIAVCKSAGIRVVMVTGDHPITAMAIARKVGIISEESSTVYDIAIRKNISTSKVTDEDVSKCQAIVVTGADLRNMEDDDVSALIVNYEELVFARTSPQQKLRIVEAFQRVGAIVAVTGDGVNDSPALKKADIGIAMGISGSSVSKEAANIILMDDNFASIVTGIEQGRLIFDNLKKSIFYVLTSNLPEIAPFVLHVFLGLPLAVTVMSVLMIDVGTDLFPAISLAYERPERDVMRRKPRNHKTDRLVNGRLMFMTYGQIGLIQTFACYACYFFLMGLNGFYWDRLITVHDDWNNVHVDNLQDSYGREWTFNQRMTLEKEGVTCYFLGIVVTQVADLLICKTRKLSLFQQGMHNWVLNFGILFEIILALTVVYTPGLNTFFQFEPINPICILPAVPFALLIIFFDEIRKYFIRKYPGGWIERETYY